MMRLSAGTGKAFSSPTIVQRIETMSYITIALKRAHKANDDRYLPSSSNRTADLLPELGRYYRELTDGSAGYGVAAVFTGRGMQEFYVNPTVTILKKLE